MAVDAKEVPGDNPLLEVDWEDVGMLSFDDNTLTITIRGGPSRKFTFESKVELDRAFAEWVSTQETAFNNRLQF